METPIQTLQNQTKLQGKYTIIGVLGKGGFGITYLAIHDNLHKKVAIKELFMSTSTMYCTRNEADTRSVMPHFSGFETFKTKFLDEARTLAKFTGKKGIVQISDTFEENNTSYFVMDYIDGKSLKTILEEQGTLSEKQTTEYALQILNALSEVHKENILHRDLKPDNLILRTADKQMMLIDFGIAREYAEDETKTQTAMMTVGFAPPEQKLLKAKRGAYTDLYSVGAVLYYCLTHQRPQTTDEISMDGYLSAKSINPAISVAMNTLIDKALTKPSAGRFQTCEEMIAALQSLHSTAKATDATDIHETIIEATVETPKNPFVEKYKEKQVRVQQKFSHTFMYIGVGVGILFWGLVLWQPWAKKQTNEQANTTTETPVNVDTAAILATQAQKEREQQAAQQAQAQKQKEEQEQADNTAWQQAQQGNSKISYQTYLSNYANGLHSQEARQAMKAFDLPTFAYEIVYLQGGTFQMGCDDSRDGNCNDDEKPLHTVRVGNFSIGKYEVTQAQWREIMGNNPSYFKGDNLPVEQVSWNDIQEFLKKLNQKTGEKYRLPTEEEWEYAARGGNQSKGYKYAGSNTIGNVAWYNGNSSSKTHPVGQKRPNELGIYDMSGNVWEWTASGWSENHEKNRSFDSYVLRGGAWDFIDNYCRVAIRSNNVPTNRYFSIGFRLTQ